ncbi:Na+/H+ antiporter NhaC family protein [Candidatus Trichorickettsia mobilis]|uniref:Na+/H+ antiporter NhaC family protein n=1 Tax=Candidatus Trichorickettsia mobilis TaxID=1346319 RepID=UPI0029315903|nr:Na+/H+ antiporter NhaC family protein [Candidatus Trichorickettsia mobilis]
MHILINFLPILFFVLLYVGSGIYYTIIGVDYAFYQVSPIVAIIPAIALAWSLYRGTTEEKINCFLDGVRHRDIITMCIIFLLSGAFGAVTKAIGSVDATVNLALSLVPAQFLLIGVFITAAFISTAIGTSMGTIATIAPIAANLIEHGAFPAEIGMATVVGGAMFGDSLSIVSDTTIAAVMSQKADPKAKFKLNAIVSLFASIITVVILLLLSNDHHSSTIISEGEYNVILIMPYILLIALPLFGTNVFVCLVVSLLFTWIIGYINQDYSIINFSNDIVKGFAHMQEIMLLSLMVGGLSGFASKSSKDIALYLSEVIRKRGNKRAAQFVIAKIVSVFDLLFANNTVAIIFSGEIAKDIAEKYKIPPHYSATWLDIFSIVFQGIIPYGAQILLVSSLANLSPVSIIPHVYYCYILGIVSIAYIIWIPLPKISEVSIHGF